jgi:hypothetical protein
MVESWWRGWRLDKPPELWWWRFMGQSVVSEDSIRGCTSPTQRLQTRWSESLRRRVPAPVGMRSRASGAARLDAFFCCFSEPALALSQPRFLPSSPSLSLVLQRWERRRMTRKMAFLLASSASLIVLVLVLVLGLW